MNYLENIKNYIVSVLNYSKITDLNNFLKDNNEEQQYFNYCLEIVKKNKNYFFSELIKNYIENTFYHQDRKKPINDWENNYQLIFNTIFLKERYNLDLLNNLFTKNINKPLNKTILIDFLKKYFFKKDPKYNNQIFIFLLSNFEKSNHKSSFFDNIDNDLYNLDELSENSIFHNNLKNRIKIFFKEEDCCSFNFEYYNKTTLNNEKYKKILNQEIINYYIKNKNINYLTDFQEIHKDLKKIYYQTNKNLYIPFDLSSSQIKDIFRSFLTSSSSSVVQKDYAINMCEAIDLNVKFLLDENILNKKQCYNKLITLKENILKGLTDFENIFKQNKDDIKNLIESSIDKIILNLTVDKNINNNNIKHKI